METLFALCFERFLLERQMCLMSSTRRRKLKSREINDEEDESPRFSEIVGWMFENTTCQAEE
jgi:hypothetical protein